MTYEECKKELQELIFGLNFPSRSPPEWIWAQNKEGGYWK